MLNGFLKFVAGKWTNITVSEVNPLPVNIVSSSNPLPVAQTDGLAVSGTATSVAVLFTTSFVGYESLSLQITSIGTSNTIIYEVSEDQITWYPTAAVASSNIGTSNSRLSMSETTSSALGQLVIPRRGTYFRARVSVYGSGTVSVAGTLSKYNPALVVDARLSGFSGEGASVSGASPTIALEARTTTKTLVTNGQSVRKIGTLDGRQIVRLNSIPENEWKYAAPSGGIVNTEDNVLIAAAGANIKNYLTGLSVANANATASEIVIKDGASTVIWRMYLAANAPIQSIEFVTPLQSTANTALNVACITTGTQTYINAQGYKAP